MAKMQTKVINGMMTSFEEKDGAESVLGGETSGVDDAFCETSGVCDSGGTTLEVRDSRSNNGGISISSLCLSTRNEE
jgi:hypothetical protein